ncbi:MAG: hypothetical protein AAB414_04400 [Patescibacteria group bacterium]
MIDPERMENQPANQGLPEGTKAAIPGAEPVWNELQAVADALPADTSAAAVTARTVEPEPKPLEPLSLAEIEILAKIFGEEPQPSQAAATSAEPVDEELLELVRQEVRKNKQKLEDKISRFTAWRQQPGNENKTLNDWEQDVPESERRRIFTEQRIDSFDLIHARVSVGELERYKAIFGEQDNLSLRMGLWGLVSDYVQSDQIPSIGVHPADRANEDVTLPEDARWRDEVVEYLTPEVRKGIIEENKARLEEIIREYTAFRNQAGNEDKTITDWLNQNKEQLPEDERWRWSGIGGIKDADDLLLVILGTRPEAGNLDSLLERLSQVFPNDKNLEYDLYARVYKMVFSKDKPSFPADFQWLTDLYGVWSPKVKERMVNLRNESISQGREELQRLMDSFSAFRAQKGNEGASVYAWIEWFGENDKSEEASQLDSIFFDLRTRWSNNLLIGIRFTRPDLEKIKQVFPDGYQEIEDTAFHELVELVENDEVPPPSPDFEGKAFLLEEDFKWRDKTYADFEEDIKEYKVRKHKEDVEKARGYVRGEVLNWVNYLAGNDELLQKFNAGQSYLENYVVDRYSYLIKDTETDEQKQRTINGEIGHILTFGIPYYLVEGEILPTDPIHKLLQRVLLSDEYKIVVDSFNVWVARARIEAGLEQKEEA